MAFFKRRQLVNNKKNNPDPVITEPGLISISLIVNGLF